MVGFRWLGILGLVIPLATMGAREASACSCLPQSSLVAPAAGMHPAGAPLRFENVCGGDLSVFEVTIDGMPAALGATQTWNGVIPVDIEPAPAQGTEVVLRECEGGKESGGCEADAIPTEFARFVIGPPDLQPPTAVDGIVLEHEEGEYHVGCDDDETKDLRISAVLEIDDPEPGTWVVLAFERDGSVVESVSLRALDQIGWSFHDSADDWRNAELCATATVLDAANNGSEVVRDCDRVDGCACTANGDATGAGWLLGIVGLTLVRRRKGLTRRAASSPAPTKLS